MNSRWPFDGHGSPLGLGVPPRRVNPLRSKLAVWVAAIAGSWGLVWLIVWAVSKWL